jgi:hypothetical protein
VPCIDLLVCRSAKLSGLVAVAAASLLVACSGPPGQAPGETRGSSAPRTIAPAPAPPLPAVAPSPAAARSGLPLPAPGPVRSWAELRRQAGERLVAANPGITYVGKVPETLLAIPVLEIELNGDGSVRNIEVLRPPRQAKDTLQIAADAVRRAGPFGNVAKLPKPWKFVETFLFDEDRKFKPRSLEN